MADREVDVVAVSAVIVVDTPIAAEAAGREVAVGGCCVAPSAPDSAVDPVSSAAGAVVAGGSASSVMREEMMGCARSPGAGERERFCD